MKSKTLWLVLLVIVTGGLALWFLTKRQATVIQGSSLPNTGTGGPLDWLNPLLSARNTAGAVNSSANNTVAQINAYAQAAPVAIKGVTDLVASIGGLFRSKSKSTPTMTTTGTLNGLGAVDFTPLNSIDSADAYFYA